MLMWMMLRQAAIARHRLAWEAAGANPATWPVHMAMIRAVYGF